MRDQWGTDYKTGCNGLEIGIRTVRKGRVKIGKEYWIAIPGRGSLSDYEGKKIEVGVSDAWSTRYVARDPETLRNIATLMPQDRSKTP